MIVKISEFLTPYIKILGHMLYDLVRFLALMLICFFMFSCIFSIWFRQLEGYETLAMTMETLFGAMLGNVDFAPFEAAPQKVQAKILYGLYLVFMMITLLNFVIAILSDTYANLSG
jgi:hypothetical protein